MATRFSRVASFVSVCTLAALVAPLVAQDAKQGPAKDAKALPVIDYKRLKEMLPDAVGEVKRSNAEGSQTAMAEMKMSQATGTYSVDGKDAHATITIMDYGAMPGAAEGMAGWAKMSIDSDSDTEYTKSVEVAGAKGLETYNKKDKGGTLMLYVGDRFIVSIEISAMPSETLKQTAEAMKLKELAALK